MKNYFFLELLRKTEVQIHIFALKIYLKEVILKKNKIHYLDFLKFNKINKSKNFTNPSIFININKNILIN